jgi:hypothetical protein
MLRRRVSKQELADQYLHQYRLLSFLPIMTKNSNQKNSLNANSNSNSKSKSNKKSQSNKSGCIIKLKPPKLTEDTVKAKFLKDDGTEVSKNIRTFQSGEDYGNLVALMSCIVGLGNMYGLWIDGKSRKLSQVMARTLDDQVREEWQTITSELNDWDQAEMKAIFIQLLQRLGTQVFGPTTFKTQCRAMEKGDIKLPEGDLRAGTHRLFQINRLLPYLGIYGEEYSLTRSL